MTHHQLSDVQLTNLTLLLTIRDGILQDRLMTCCRFDLGVAEAERIAAMDVQQIIALVANVGNSTLFHARRDLIALLDAPLPLTRPLAAVQTHSPR